MIERITYLFELFDKRVWKFQKTTETAPQTIETNVTDTMLREMMADSKNEKDIIRTQFAEQRIGA